MQSIADGLPPDVAQQIHPDWRKNEAEYWASRDSLIAQFADHWVAFADGTVIATGTSPVEIFHLAEQSGKHSYVTCVGHEHEPCRMRRATFPYDQSYANEALPLVTVEFRKLPNQSGVALDHVIPDTGADASHVITQVCSTPVPSVQSRYSNALWSI